LDGGESWAAAGHTLTEGNYSWLAWANSVNWGGSIGTWGSTGSLEVEESTEAWWASSWSITSRAWIGTIRANSSSGTDGWVLACGTEVERWTGGTSRSTSNTSLLVGIKELMRKASLFTDGSSFNVSSCP